MGSPNQGGKTAKVNPFAYKSMFTKGAMKQSIEDLKYNLTDAIKNSFPTEQQSEIPIGESINSIECNDEQHLALLGTDTGHILHYDYVKKEAVETFTKTREHGISRISVSDSKEVFVVGAPKGIYLYKGIERVQIVQTLSK